MKSFTESRVTTNLNIIQQLKQGGTIASADLKAYTGWGGLREAVYTPTIYQQLKALLTADEIKGIKATLGSAYYTPDFVVKFIYECLSTLELNGGRILEPAIGNGVFIEHMPTDLQANSEIVAVELDGLTSDITQRLYPALQLHNTPFEQFQPVEKFDLILGNPPYGATKLRDAQHLDLKSYCIHHYFVAKCMRLLKEGGILAMVLPSYFLDNVEGHVRGIIHAEGGGLLAAYRLPDDCFSDAKVTVDIVFLQKGLTNEAWQSLVDVQVGNVTKPMNAYFYQHSHHILGNLDIVPMYGRQGLACKTRGDIQTLLSVEASRLKNTHALRQSTSQDYNAIMQKVDTQLAELHALRANLLVQQRA